MRLLLLSLLISCFGQILKAQNSNPTINNQFNELITSSSRYLDNRVVKTEKILALQQNTIDSIENLKNKNALLTAEKQNQLVLLQAAEQKANRATTQIKNLEGEINRLSFLGIGLSKSLFYFIIWFLIIALFVLVTYNYYRYKKAHVYTKAAQEKQSNLEEEFETFRQKALEREQKVRRQLQDEINKNKGN